MIILPILTRPSGLRRSRDPHNPRRSRLSHYPRPSLRTALFARAVPRKHHFDVGGSHASNMSSRQHPTDLETKGPSYYEINGLEAD